MHSINNDTEIVDTETNIFLLTDQVFAVALLMIHLLDDGVVYLLPQNTVYGKTFEEENFRGCAQNTIHWKIFAVHQAHAIMYCTQQMIQGENFRDWLKNCENRESFPPRKFCRIRYSSAILANNHNVFYCSNCNAYFQP